MLALSEVLTQLCRLFRVPEVQHFTICQNIKKTRLTLKVAGRKPLAAARDEELYWSEQSSEGGSRETIVVNTAEETEEGAQNRERGGGGCVHH